MDEMYCICCYHTEVNVKQQLSSGYRIRRCCKNAVFQFIWVGVVCFGCGSVGQRGVCQKTQQTAAEKLSQINFRKEGFVYIMYPASKSESDSQFMLLNSDAKKFSLVGAQWYKREGREKVSTGQKTKSVNESERAPASHPPNGAQTCGNMLEHLILSQCNQVILDGLGASLWFTLLCVYIQFRVPRVTVLWFVERL